MLKLIYRISSVISLAVVLILAIQNVSFANPYGDGAYGECEYNNCSISLSTSGSVAANITPSGGSTTCSVQSDSVGVNTDSSVGYSVTLGDSTSDTDLVGASHGSSIPAISATLSSPSTLIANSWGYRVDGLDSLGIGPTTALSSGSIPSLTFAGIESSLNTPDTIISTSSAANPTQTTLVWYGVCANDTKPADSYSNAVTYTAIVN